MPSGWFEIYPSFRRKPESERFQWTPVYAGMAILWLKHLERNATAPPVKSGASCIPPSAVKISQKRRRLLVRRRVPVLISKVGQEPWPPGNPKCTLSWPPSARNPGADALLGAARNRIAHLLRIRLPIVIVHSTPSRQHRREVRLTGPQENGLTMPTRRRLPRHPLAGGNNRES